MKAYNPDWAYVEEHDGEQRVYFVAETKGESNGQLHVTSSEADKIKCARKHFAALDLGESFQYEAVSLYSAHTV